MKRWCASTVLAATLGLLAGTTCTIEDGLTFEGDAGGSAGARAGGPSGASAASASGGRGAMPGVTAGTSSSGFGGSPSAAGGRGQTVAGGMNGQGLATGIGGSNGIPAAGNAGALVSPSPAGSCVAGAMEPCGECGTRVCDAFRLEWNACIGDGAQRSCWETPEGQPLPGEMPEEPKGNCTAGSQTCVADGTWSACSGAVAPAASDDCSVAGDDSNCSGMPNDGCNCTPGMMRACGTNDGNCQQGTQVCTANTWGPCEDEIKPAASDSCLVTGDDANCNGMPNQGCMCVADNPMACDDNVACTDDVCTNGVCSNPTSAGFCRIGGQCYPDGASEPGNPCRFCDADANRNGWSNRPSSVTCDDGQWCNGNDVCSGGVCTHEFAGNRCTANGPCALSVCDEARDSCFRPNTFECSSNVETRCSSANACGGDVQTRTVARKCSGNSAACDGATSNGSWTTSTDCNNNQVCQASGSNYSCVSKLGCGSTWCNGSLCWTTTNPGKRTVAAATAYCNDLVLAGTSTWRLPTIYEYLDLFTGCNGLTGMPQSGASQCRYTGEFVDCNACPVGDGPGTNGCYWPSGMGNCDTSDSATGGYWSAQPANAIPLGFDFGGGHGFFYPTIDAPFQFRCVTAAN